MRTVDSPSSLEDLFVPDPETHLYGLADLEEPFWSNSTWYRDGNAAVGLVSVGEEWMTVYAMSRVAPVATLDLLGRIRARVPAGTWVTGPTGMHATISRLGATRDVGPHWRMILDELVEVEGHVEAVPLTMADLDPLTDLYASDPGQAFFLPSMLAGNLFVGVWDGEQLVAAAGTHVASQRYGVAAVGAVITRPSHRGRGLGSVAVSALCSRLVDHYETVGLNVETANEPALSIYARLGFRRAFQYEEIELL